MSEQLKGQVRVKDLPPHLQRKLRRQKIVPSLKAKKLNRSVAGNTLLFTLMGICAVFMVLPLVMIVNNALKPLDELFQYPPKIWVRNPHLENFSDLFNLMNDSWVPFSRYMMNTVIITGLGMVGHVIVASLAAYPLAKHHFPGKGILFSMVVLSMMFSWTVTQIPQYAIISWLGINNTYWALVLLVRSMICKIRLDENGVEVNNPLLGCSDFRWEELNTAAIVDIAVQKQHTKVILLSIREPEEVLTRAAFQRSASKHEQVRIPYTDKRREVVEHYLHMELPEIEL